MIAPVFFDDRYGLGQGGIGPRGAQFQCFLMANFQQRAFFFFLFGAEAHEEGQEGGRD